MLNLLFESSTFGFLRVNEANEVPISSLILYNSDLSLFRIPNMLCNWFQIKWFIWIVIILSDNWALCQVRIYIYDPIHTQFCSHFHERCAHCWVEWKINFLILAIYIFWVMADCIYNLPKNYRPKKEFISVQIFREDADCSENDFLYHGFFLCDFRFLRYGRFGCMQRRRYRGVRGGYALSPTLFTVANFERWTIYNI